VTARPAASGATFNGRREPAYLADARTGLAIPFVAPGGRPNVGRVLADGIRIMGIKDRFADLVAAQVAPPDDP